MSDLGQVIRGNLVAWEVYWTHSGSPATSSAGWVTRFLACQNLGFLICKMRPMSSNYWGICENYMRLDVKSTCSQKAELPVLSPIFLFSRESFCSGKMVSCFHYKVKGKNPFREMWKQTSECLTVG